MNNWITYRNRLRLPHLWEPGLRYNTYIRVTYALHEHYLVMKTPKDGWGAKLVTGPLADNPNLDIHAYTLKDIDTAMWTIQKDNPNDTLQYMYKLIVMI